MGEIIRKINQQVLDQLNGQYGSDKQCPVCPKPTMGLSLSSAPIQSSAGVYCLPALIEAVPAGVRLAHEQFLVVVAIKCERCGSVRLFDGTAEAKEILDQQGAFG
jgi:hypothetical protein